jgi:aspartyl-tRNA synthetase
MRGVFEEFGKGRPVTPEFPRIAYRDAMLKYGTDKPDLRNPIEMQVVSEHFAGSGFKIFAGMLEKPGNEIRAIPAPKGGSRKFCDRMNSFAQKEGLPGMGYIFWREAVNGMEAAGPLAKNIGPERTEAIRQQLGLGVGDAAFFLGGKPSSFIDAAGKARNVIGEELGLTNKDRFDFCWVVDFPLFEWDEEARKIDFSHNPFSMPQGGLEALETQDPLDILGWQYDIVCNGVELSSGAIRNHKPEIMFKAFEIAGHSKEFVEAAWRHRARHRPHGDAVGRRREHPRGHHVPDEPARRGPDDAGPGRGDTAADARPGIAADPEGVTWPLDKLPAAIMRGCGSK